MFNLMNFCSTKMVLISVFLVRKKILNQYKPFRLFDTDLYVFNKNN
jgi:hypothetical protein